MTIDRLTNIEGLLWITIYLSLGLLWLLLFYTLITWGPRFLWPPQIVTGNYLIWDLNNHTLIPIPVYEPDHNARDEFFTTYALLILTLVWIALIHYSEI